MLLTLIAFLLILGILVFVHELGHFIVAKWTGMRVDEFAIGFPPRLFARKKGETTYAINWIPFGGYVKIHGETPGTEDSDHRAFNHKSVWARILVIVAGVTMNVIFAFVVLTVAFSVGFASFAQDLSQVPGAKVVTSQVLVVDTLDKSPAAEAGIQAGDIIQSITNPDGVTTPVSTDAQLIAATQTAQAAHETALTVHLTRNGTDMGILVTINQTGPALGVDIAPYEIVRIPAWRAPGAALKEMGFIVSLTWSALGGFVHTLFFQGKLDSSVSGPVGIYQATNQATQEGWVQVIFLTVALSLNLALLNILPIPALDGGKLLFLVIEILIGKKRMDKHRNIEGLVTFVGFVMVIGLVVVLSVRDIIHLF